MPTELLAALCRRRGDGGIGRKRNARRRIDLLARAGGALEIAVLCPDLGALRSGHARNVPARAAIGAHGGSCARDYQEMRDMFLDAPIV